MNMPSFFRSLLLFMTVAAVPAFAAVNRTITITAPASAKAGQPLQFSVTAATEAGDAEQIAFFHAEYSNDNGATWQTRYAENVGRKVTRQIDFQAGPAGSKALVRVRVAFRGGKAGDVDYTGAKIDWNGSWTKWAEPPARVSSITVSAR
jgi:hypothetical protein